MYVVWPKKHFGSYWSGGEPASGDWAGSLIRGNQDVSGLMYRRNRYYDPATGQFTQSDPIGIAGGLNTYGFAAGDPTTITPTSEPPMRLIDGLAPLRRAGGAFWVVEHQVGEAFGDELLTLTDGSLAFRLIRDRGQLFLDLRIAGTDSGWIDASAAARELGQAVPSIFPCLESIITFILANRGELPRVLRANHTAPQGRATKAGGRTGADGGCESAGSCP